MTGNGKIRESFVPRISSGGVQEMSVGLLYVMGEVSHLSTTGKAKNVVWYCHLPSVPEPSSVVCHL